MIRRLIQLILDAQSARKLEKEVGRSMNKVARESESTMSKAFKRIGGFLVAAFSVRLIANFTKEMFKLGSSAAETGSKFETVFGAERAAELDKFIGQWANLAGLTRSEGRDMLAIAGSIAQGMGFASDESARFAEQIVRLAGDFQSFHDVPIAETFAAIRSGITGETEPLKRLGIVLRAADVDARALGNTGKKTAKDLTEQERATARLQLITERAGVAIGDLDRTQDSAANTARRIAARFRDIRETIATGLLPVFEELLPLFDQLSRKAEAFARNTGSVVQALLDLAGVVDSTLSVELAGIERQMRSLDEAQRQAFLTSRLQGAAAEYESLFGRIRTAQQAIFDSTPEFERVGKAVEDMTNRPIREMQEELLRAGAIMNAISRMMGTTPASPGGGGGGGGEDDAARRRREEEAWDFQMAMWDDEERAREANRQAEEERWQQQMAIWDAEAEALAATEEFKREQLEKTKEKAAGVAEHMTSAFTSFFEATALGFGSQEGVLATAGDAAREAGAAIIGGLVAGRAETEVALGTAALAAGLWPPNPAAIASGLKHFAAAALLRAIPGVIRGAGGGGGGGGGSAGGAIPRGAIGSSTPGTRQPAAPEVHIYMDPLSPSNAKAQRFVQGATQQAQERFGPNVQVKVHPRSSP